MSAPASTVAASPPAPRDDRPPGERYYRHPGDVVRLVGWGSAVLLLLLFLTVATATSDGVRADLGGVVTAVPTAVRQLLLVIVQIAAVVIAVALVAVLAWQRRWRRLATAIGAAALGAAAWWLIERALDEPARLPGSLAGDSWLLSSRFPSPGALAGAFAALTVGLPWLARPWRRASDIAVAVLTATMALAGTAGAPELLLVLAVGGAVGSAVLVVVGAPNRRPTRAAVALALADTGFEAPRLDLQRVVGGRSQLYRVTGASESWFVKVYAEDSRDADLLYRWYRRALLRDPGDAGGSPTLAGEVEHEALLLMLAERAGVACPQLRAVVPLGDGSMALAMTDVAGVQLDSLAPEALDPELLDRTWHEVARLHRSGLAHRALRAGNILVGDDGRPVLIDLGFGAAAASARLQAIDRAELLASLAALVGPQDSVASAVRVIDRDDLVAALPYLQPLALSHATRAATSKSLLREVRELLAAAIGADPVPLAQLVRVRPRTLIMIATLTGAFYILLPQLANVDESIRALRSANWLWLAGALVMSALTYVFSAVGLLGGVGTRLPFATTVEASVASSFVNRVTPANVGGMALNIRYMQKAGVPPAEAATGMGLNVIAGGIVHLGLLVGFFAWAGQSSSTSFSVPGGSKLLVVIAVLLAVAGVVIATRRGRHLVRSRVGPALRRSLAGVVSLARSPARLALLFGGSVGVTLAYIAALACAMSAFDSGTSFAQIGAVYLGASLIAAAAPTPGGLGAIEAALVAGLTGVGVDPAIAVAGVLSYRLVTYWVPILPGWLSFRRLDRRGYI